jgi:ribonuclease E
MTKRMLIDATHAEETRVVVADGNQLVEFDYETSTKKQLKGNIYLAKVIRVEPSLQAAFVEFGGNRHGFLAFNEIHPDYYRIPVEDREALLAEQTDVAASHEAEEAHEADEAHDVEDAHDVEEVHAATESVDAPDTDGEAAGGEPEQLRESGEEAEQPVAAVPVEVLDGDDADEIQELGETQRQRIRSLTRQYKIQEVIKRRQILLVQVVKEERGNKGAALTTYLSLPGRYCVLMPNTARGGGISRKVSNPAQRKAMKAIMSDLEVSEGMAVIMRTAGVGRTRTEIKRDYEYLRRLWDEIRELTLQSSAPALIYEEGDVIKRSLRDTYNRDIDEVLIEGEEAYKSAKALMKTMIPSHAKRVQKYAETDIPLFNRYQIEQQLDLIYDPVVTLKSGGYLVINPTEALVAIDVNSGRATRQRNVEGTARQTNLEAAEEIARQLRLRDLAGLIVIDFIDMEENRNNAAVERKLKEAMKADRARIQIGRISPFGLLELSRQRLRPSLNEASSQICPMCGGSGHVRSTESTALRILRAIEDEGIRRRSSEIQVNAPTTVALYLLNQKRHALNEIEARYDFRVFINGDADLVPPDFQIERLQDAETGERPVEESRAGSDEEDRSGRRRRRGGRRRRDEEAAEPIERAADEHEDADDEAEETAAADGERREEAGDEERGSRRRRGRRGGRRRRRTEDGATAEEGAIEAGADGADADESAEADGETAAAETGEDEEARPARRRRRRPRRRSTAAEGQAEAQADAEGDSEAVSEAVEGESEAAADMADAGDAEATPRRRRRPRRPRTERTVAGSDAATGDSPESDDAETEAAETEAAETEAAADEHPAIEADSGETPPGATAEDQADTVTEPANDDTAVAGENGHAATTEPEPEPAAAEPTTPRPQRRGWWNRMLG